VSDFIEWVPKHHGHQPLHWKPDMLTSVDGKNFVRQPNWAWIAGSVYYVPPEAVGMVREDVEEETGVDRKPDDWILLKAAELSDTWCRSVEWLRELYQASGSFRALCDMIQKYEKQP
jgi:hypothetical protein